MYLFRWNVVFVIFFKITCAFGEGKTTLGQAGTDPLGFSIFPIATMHDMKGEKWKFAVSPGYWMIDKIAPQPSAGAVTSGAGSAVDTFPGQLKGYVLGLSLQRELNAHWGVGGLFGIAKQMGAAGIGEAKSGMAPTSANSGTAGGAGFAGGEISNVSGLTAGVLVTYDPFDNSEGFRLPMSIGPFWATQGFDFTNAFTNPNNSRSQEESVAFRRTFYGLIMNISADFVIAKDFRLMPGMVYGMGFADTDPSVDYVVKQNGTTASYPNRLFDVRPEFGTPYVQAEYRPWNLSYAMPLMFLVGGGFITATTLQWRTEW